jgi:hypothetical protein
VGKGIDIRATSSELLFRVSLKASGGAKLATGTTTLRLYELQTADGTLKSYDFSSNTFKTTALTTPTLAMTHRQGNNSTYDTGIWTARLATLTGFTSGLIYIVQISNTGAMPPEQEREFQYGSGEGDFVVDSTGRVTVGSNADKTGYGLSNLDRQAIAAIQDTATSTKAKTDTLPASPAAVGSAMTLTAGERTSIAAAQLATTVDGVALSTVLTNINAAVKGVVGVTDNGDDTFTLSFKKEDGTTPAFTRTFNPSTGVRS